jgi:chromosome segregation ATPase
LRIGWLLLRRIRLRRTLFEAETELGWLGWEQVDFFDPRLTEQVRKVQEFENAQANLLNTSAELSGRKNEVAQTLAQHASAHDQAQAELAAERAPLAASLEQSEATRRLKLGAVERFDRALDEMTRREKRLAARAAALQDMDDGIHTRIEEREVSDELSQLAAEKKLVAADKVTAASEAETLEQRIRQLRIDLSQIDTAIAEARNKFAAARASHDAEIRILDRERKKSSLHMAHLDKEKRKPYRIIGAALADDRISPLNQPEVLTKVHEFREKDAEIEQAVTDLRAACAAADRGVLITFYLLLLALLFILSLFIGALVRHG